ncbi:hypothetical protein BDV18DRAFT_144144 [Aspergillus unguis]
MATLHWNSRPNVAGGSRSRIALPVFRLERWFTDYRVLLIVILIHKRRTFSEQLSFREPTDCREDYGLRTNTDILRFNPPSAISRYERKDTGVQLSARHVLQRLSLPIPTPVQLQIPTRPPNAGNYWLFVAWFSNEFYSVPLDDPTLEGFRARP